MFKRWFRRLTLRQVRRGFNSQPIRGRFPSMTSSQLQSSRGTIVRAEPGRVVFQPLDTSYQLTLEASDDFAMQLGRNVRGRVRVKARKIYGVPSGGNFIQPILGTPRIIQGRVIDLDDKTITVKAAAIFVVELPTGLDTIDLHHGAIGVNALVNVVALPGAAFEIVPS